MIPTFLFCKLTFETFDSTRPQPRNEKPFLIFTALHESNIQAAIACAQKQDLHVADKLDENLFIRLILDMVNGTNVEKTGRATFIALFLGD